VSESSTAVKIEDISPVKKKIHFHIPWADVKEELDAVYRKIGRSAKIKGFRPGKIPRPILEQHYRGQAEEDTLANLVNRHYWETLQREAIQAVTHPENEPQGIEAEKDFAFTATVEVEPVLEPKDYLGLALQKTKVAVTDQDLKKRLAEISQMFATMEDLPEDRAVAAGDFATIDFSGTVGGEALKGAQGRRIPPRGGLPVLHPGL
jgi:trigger factor